MTNQPKIQITVHRRGRGYEAVVMDERGERQLAQPGLTPDDAIGRVIRMTLWRFEELGVSLTLAPGMYGGLCRSCGGSGIDCEKDT